MNCTYRVIKSQHTNEKGETYESFGIQAIKNEIVVNTIFDVFLNEKDAIELVNKCNELELAEEHLIYVIYDALV